jgi:hypothetical protein
MVFVRFPSRRAHLIDHHAHLRYLKNRAACCLSQQALSTMTDRQTVSMDDSSCSGIYTTDANNKDDFAKPTMTETLLDMTDLLDRTLLVDDADDDLSEMNFDGNDSVLSDNALFRAEVEVRVKM